MKRAWPLPCFEQGEEIVPFLTVMLGLSHPAENPPGSPGEHGSREKAAHRAEAPLTQAQININRRRASGPWADAHISCGRVRRGPRWPGWVGQTPPSAPARPSSGSISTAGV